MKLTLIIIGIASVAFIAGFLLAAWVRQPDLEKERVELALCRDREAKLQQLVDSLESDASRHCRGRGAEDCVKLPANFKDLIDQQESLEAKRAKVLMQLESSNVSDEVLGTWLLLLQMILASQATIAKDLLARVRNADLREC